MNADIVPGGTPLADIERELCTAVGELLEIAPHRVDPNVPLISLGLDSLAAVNLQHRVESALGLSISIADLLADATISTLAHTLADSGRSADRDPARDTAEPVWTGEHPDRIPLSSTERRLWFLDQLTPGTTAYTLAGRITLTGDLDTGALTAALTDVVTRHETLRTDYPADDQGPYRRIHPPGPHPLPHTDLTAGASAPTDEITARLEQ
ncbi:phosphopantetheine-binding protein, partial [Rhizohabitans arisaemae]|uniref:phosphopantetheine-binding protein n=1 Tax=Rhizohabitans arisaemae TaxID=2720610 RepID=UPI0024B09AAC